MTSLYVRLSVHLLLHHSYISFLIPMMNRLEGLSHLSHIGDGQEYIYVHRIFTPVCIRVYAVDFLSAYSYSRSASHANKFLRRICRRALNANITQASTLDRIAYYHNLFNLHSSIRKLNPLLCAEPRHYHFPLVGSIRPKPLIDVRACTVYIILRNHRDAVGNRESSRGEVETLTIFSIRTSL